MNDYCRDGLSEVRSTLNRHGWRAVFSCGCWRLTDHGGQVLARAGHKLALVQRVRRLDQRRPS